MQFVHKSTRLSCDLTRAFRYFTAPLLMEKWMGQKSKVDLKSGGAYGLTVTLEEIDCVLDTSGSTIKTYDREKILEVDWQDSLSGHEAYELTVRFMPCRSDTEYCSEIHLMFKHKHRTLNEEEVKRYSDIFEALLEKIRKCQNKDWIIKDSDLTMSWLKGKGF
ncbi:SRPBCC domain-containing protein [Fusibacter sp. JL216-2]|uniref:SRPBCC domain-containing protein n=1 Tax=Fusibacter sp. JL216-2 TaxID=3071453 RepID=UPI003D34F27B